MDKVYQYQVYCVEENKYVTLWGTTEPTLCPNNHPDRTINTEATTIISEISEQLVTIKEEYVPTQGLYKTFSHKMAVDPGPDVDTVFELSFPFSITILSIHVQNTDENIGDIVNVISAPDTTIGTIASPASVSDTTFTVSQTVIDNIKVGYIIKLTDGVNTDNLGYVLSIDKSNLTVTTENSVTHNYIVNSLVKIDIERIKNYYIVSSYPTIIGDKKIGGSNLPANVKARLIYTNKSGAAKNFHFLIEMLY